MEEEDPFSEDLPDLFLSQLLQGTNKNELEPYKTHKNSTEDQPTENHLKFLSKTFGHRNFRPMQWKIISSILHQKRDNLAIMTTGYGKSLCYQFPSAFKNSITLVISPLISLMEDQVLSLTVSSIPACLLGSAQIRSRETIDNIFKNKYRLVYLTPEYCTGDAGRDILEQMNQKLDVTLIAIDEAHCVTSWGHDFRHSYRKLSVLKEIFPNVPILAVTATATPIVKSDIIKVLKLKNPQVLCTGFDRPNLYFSAFPKEDTFRDLKKFMVRSDGKWVFPGPTIIYCLTKKDTTDICELLNSHDVNCVTYHAGMSLGKRKAAHEDFIKDRISVIVATIAFGMGIDKPDIRLIIHYGAPTSIEGYYQEVGRAGRDGLPAKCVAYWTAQDFFMHSYLSQRDFTDQKHEERKAAMSNEIRDYMTTTKCRRLFILSHFGDNQQIEHPKNCCDNCNKKVDTQLYEGVNKDGMYDFTDDAVTFLSAIDAVGGKCGMEKIILFLKGSKSSKVYESWKKHALYSTGAQKSDMWWKEISNLMLQEKWIARQFNKGSSFSYTSFHISSEGKDFLNDVSKKGIKLLRSPSTTLLNMLKKREEKEKTVPDASTSGWTSVGSSKLNIGSFRSTQEIKQTLGAEEKNEIVRLYQLLMEKRRQLADAYDAMPYTIATNAALMDMAKKTPRNLDDLRKIQADGFTEAKIEKFGSVFVKIIVNNCKKNPREKLCTNSVPNTIENILAEHPIKDYKFSPSARATYTLYKAGSTIDEIVTQRKFARGTIFSHLIEAMKFGCPVTLRSLGVTDDELNIIVGVVNTLETNSPSLTAIKLASPDHITYDQIKAIRTYLEVRDHLQKLGIPYKDFEDYNYDQLEFTQCVDKSENCSSKNDGVEDGEFSDDQNDVLRAISSQLSTEKDKEAFIDPNRNSNGSRSKASSCFNDDQDDILIAAINEVDAINERTRDTSSVVENKSPNDFNFDEGDDDILLAACTKLEDSFQEGKDALTNPQDDDILLAACSKLEDSLQEDKDISKHPQATSEPPAKKVKSDLNKFLKLTEDTKKSSNVSKKQKLPPWLSKKRVG